MRNSGGRVILTTNASACTATTSMIRLCECVVDHFAEDERAVVPRNDCAHKRLGLHWEIAIWPGRAIANCDSHFDSAAEKVHQAGRRASEGRAAAASPLRSPNRQWQPKRVHRHNVRLFHNRREGSRRIRHRDGLRATTLKRASIPG